METIGHLCVLVLWAAVAWFGVIDPFITWRKK